MKTESAVDGGRLPNGMIPYQHQIDAANQILHERSTLLAYDVGVGKSLTAILVGRTYQQITGGKIVVVAPASLQTNWLNETRGLLDIELFSAGKIPSPYDFGDDKFYLVLDEAHYYQNNSSKRTQKIVALSKLAQGVLPMTATPIRNYPSNLFPLLKIVGHPLGNNFEAFKREYCGGKIAGSSNLKKLHREVLTKVITGSKEDHLDLPEFKRTLKQLPNTGVLQILFRGAFDKSRDEYKQRIRSGKYLRRDGRLFLLINSDKRHH